MWVLIICFKVIQRRIVINRTYLNIVGIMSITPTIIVVYFITIFIILPGTTITLTICFPSV